MATATSGSDSVETRIYDVAIVGGGIIGLSTAMQLLERSPNLSVAVMEKEPELARHQTGHNSGGHPFGNLLPARFVEIPFLRWRKRPVD